MKSRFFKIMALFLCCITAAFVFQGCGSEEEKSEPTSVSSAQQDDSTELEMGAYKPVPVPQQIKDIINELYPGSIFLEYDVGKNFIEADILDGKTHKEVTFSQSYEWKYTEWDIPYENLPEAVKNAAKQACSEKGYTIEDTTCRESPEGALYFVEAENGDKEIKLCFDESGNEVQAP